MKLETILTNFAIQYNFKKRFNI